MLPWASNVCRLAFFLSVYEEEEDIYIYIYTKPFCKEVVSTGGESGPRIRKGCDTLVIARLKEGHGKVLSTFY